MALHLSMSLFVIKHYKIALNLKEFSCDILSTNLLCIPYKKKKKKRIRLLGFTKEIKNIMFLIEKFQETSSSIYLKKEKTNAYRRTVFAVLRDKYQYTKKVVPIKVFNHSIINESK